MTKKILLTALMFMIGWGVGRFYKPIHKPVEAPPYSCNRIPKYDFYDYEEAVLKEGDEDKLRSILCECGVVHEGRAPFANFQPVLLHIVHRVNFRF